MSLCGSYFCHFPAVVTDQDGLGVIKDEENRYMSIGSAPSKFASPLECKGMIGNDGNTKQASKPVAGAGNFQAIPSDLVTETSIGYVEEASDNGTGRMVVLLFSPLWRRPATTAWGRDL